jgi:AraC-like DNA-binding protein
MSETPAVIANPPASTTAQGPFIAQDGEAIPPRPGRGTYESWWSGVRSDRKVEGSADSYRAVDVLSQVLQQIRLSGAVLFRSNFRAPWCIATQSEGTIVEELLPPQAHLISFHVVLHGRMWARLSDGEPIPIDGGEVVLIPHGDAHLIGDSLGYLPLGADEFLGSGPLVEMRDVHWGDGEERNRLLCGYLACNRDAFSPLFNALPRLFKVRLAQSHSAEAEPLLKFAEQQAVSSHPGADGSRLRVAELMFVEALRRYMEAMPAGGHGWLAGLRDPIVGRAMAMLHSAPARRWTVDALAKANAISRSALAERFAQTLGESPMHYLAKWRMLLAATRLREGRDSVARIAESVGYDSPPAFQRAFLRHVGTTPARWRDGERGGLADPTARSLEAA